jgi:hypothetical protein
VVSRCRWGVRGWRRPRDGDLVAEEIVDREVIGHQVGLDRTRRARLTGEGGHAAVGGGGEVDAIGRGPAGDVEGDGFEQEGRPGDRDLDPGAGGDQR